MPDELQQAQTPPLRVIAVARNFDAPSFQQRVLAFVQPLAERGVESSCLQMPPSGERKRLLADLPNYDLLWLHRATFSPLNVRPWRRAARRIIFDFDDAIMLSTHGLGLSRRIKFACTLRRCDAVTTASQYLAAHARKYCPCVEIVPMAVDIPDQGDRGGSAGSTQLLLRQDPLADPRLSPSLSGKTCSPTILWLGSKSTHRYLAEIAPALAQLVRERPEARLRLVGHEPFAAGDLKVDFRRWSPQEQELALNECDIGLCPMPDTPWSRGKCPYKVLQYMAASMAWVGSAVGENLVCAVRRMRLTREACAPPRMPSGRRPLSASSMTTTCAAPWAPPVWPMSAGTTPASDSASAWSKFSATWPVRPVRNGLE